MVSIEGRDTASVPKVVSFWEHHAGPAAAAQEGAGRAAKPLSDHLPNYCTAPAPEGNHYIAQYTLQSSKQATGSRPDTASETV